MNKLFTLLVALPLFLNAQNRGDVELGIGGGFNLVAFYGGDAEGYDFRNSFLGGITGEYYFSDELSLKTGLLYDSKGGIGKNNNEFALDYLFIPLYANWHFGYDKNWYLNFGPYFDLLLDAQEEGNDIKDNVEPFDVGMGVGIGRKFRISDNASVFIEYQGAGGFLEVFENVDRFNVRSALNAGIIFIP